MVRDREIADRSEPRRRRRRYGHAFAQQPTASFGEEGEEGGGEEVYLPQVEERMVWCGLRGVECTGRDWARIQEKTKLGDGERGGYTRPRMCVLNPVLRF